MFIALSKGIRLRVTDNQGFFPSVGRGRVSPASAFYGEIMADIDTVDELFAIVGSAGTYTIAAGTYDLSAKTGGGANLVFTANITLTPDGGDVIIDGVDTYTVTFKNATFSIGNLTNSITFTQGADDCVHVYGDTANTIATFNKCYFTESLAESGLKIESGAGFTATVKCYYCQANNNALDGFTIKRTLSTTDDIVKLWLIECEANDNADNGTTAHNKNHFTYIVGGSYIDNLGANSNGAHIHTGGSNLSITGGCYTEGNGYGARVTTSSTTDSGFLYIDGATFINKAGAYTKNAISYDWSGASVPTLKPCVIRNTYIDQALIADNIVYIEAATYVEVSNCIIQNCTTASKYAVRIDAVTYPSQINGNIIYNVYGGPIINSATAYVSFQNNIFHTCTYGIYDGNGATAASVYTNVPENGYNCFYNCTYSLKYGTIDSGKDITSDPKLLDAANDDFSFILTSPCLNAGAPLDYSGKLGVRSIGAWKQSFGIRKPSMGD